jgi:hypothetical protein
MKWSLLQRMMVDDILPNKQLKNVKIDFFSTIKDRLVPVGN